MTNIMEISEHCRLCLVKDEVNIPIFEDEGDLRQVLLKITACLPVKIAKNDSLPKRICDGCLYKLESFYQFWNTSVNSEKQLLQWLAETLNGDAEANLHALKQEPTDNLQTESQVFLQQQLAYQDTENYGEHFDETNYKSKKTSTKKERDREKRERERERKREEVEEEAEAPAPKRKRRAATKKPAIEIDDDDDDEEYVPPSAAITKTEDDSEEGNDDPTDDYGGDENASDDNQDDDTEPGPSGTTKSSSDAPYFRNWKRIRTAWNIDDNSAFRKYEKKCNLKKAVVLVGDMDQFSPDKYPLVFINAKIGKLAINLDPEYGLEASNIIASMRNKYKCDICLKRYQTYIELKYHIQSHEDEDGSDYRPDEEEPFPITKTTLPDCQSNFIMEQSPIRENSSASELECEVCGANFDNNLRYEAHIILHKKFSCTNCSARFSTSNELVNHAMQIHGIVHESMVQQKASKDGKETDSVKEKHCLNHSEAEVLKYRCKVCNRRFADCFQLQRHKRMHSKDTKSIEEKQIVKIGCDLCNQEFSCKEDMHEHRKEHLKPLSILDDDDIIIVSVDDVAKPMNSVIDVDSSDSDSDAVNIIESPVSEPTVTISVPSLQSPSTYTTVNTTAGEMNELFTITEITSNSTPNQMVHANEVDPIILNKAFTPKSKFQCMLCNFTSTSEIIINEHNKIHGTNSSYCAQPSQLRLTATINQNLSQIANIVANTNENSAKTTDHISTTTITTPSSVSTVPSTSWGNQVVIISPSQASGQIIQHPIFIIPGNNSSNNTSNVDINIRTTNQPKASPKTITTNKSASVLTKTLRKILPLTKSDASSLFLSSKKSVISNVRTTDSLFVQDNIALNLIQSPEQFSIDVDEDIDKQTRNFDMSNNPGLVNITEQTNSGIFVIESLLKETSSTDIIQDQNIDALFRDTVIKSNANQSEVFTSDAASQFVIQKPKISVKPLSLLMKSPVKGNTVEIEPEVLPEIEKLNTSPEQIVQNETLVQIEEEATSRPVKLPTLTPITKPLFIDSVSKKSMHIIEKSKPRTVKLPITKLVASPTTTAIATTKTTSTLTAVVTKDAPKMPKTTSQNKAGLKTPTTLKNAFKRGGKKPDSVESTPTLERGVHKCDSCSYEAKKRSKLHMHCKFKCKLCQFITCKLSNLDVHYEVTHDILNICCPCDIRFPDSNSLLEHKNQVHVCPNCNKCQIDLVKHINGYKCPLCNFTTCKQNILNTHYKATHNIIRNCAPCDIAFGSVTDFEDHKYSMHYCPKCKTYKMNLNVHKSFCRGDAVKILDRVESLKNLEVIEVD